jgi:hypothetical protein
VRPRGLLGAERSGPAELVVTDNPVVGQAGQAAIQEIERDLPLLLERDARRDIAFLAPCLVVGPLLRQVEPPIEGGVTRRGGIILLCQLSGDPLGHGHELTE